MASAIPGAAVVERTIAVPFDRVWDVAGDLEEGFARYQTDMRKLRVVAGRGEHFVATARSRFGFRARLSVILRPGWCWMQSRFLLVGVAASPCPEGTLVALTGGVRVPGHAMIIPVLARHESAHALRRLEELLLKPPR
jgi:hypothetical protein